MSIATRQTMSIVAMTSGCMATIEEEHLADNQLATVLYIKDLADRVLIQFNTMSTGDLNKNYIWMQSKVDEWNAFITKYVESRISALVLVQMCMLTLDRLLLSHIRDPKKIALLLPLEESLKGLSDQIDPDGTEYQAYEEAEKVVFRYCALLGLTEQSKKDQLTLIQLRNLAQIGESETALTTLTAKAQHMVDTMQFPIRRQVFRFTSAA